MNCFMITLGSEIFDDYVYTDHEKARQRLLQLQAEAIEDAKKYGDKSYEDEYELRVFKLVEEQG